MRVTTLPISLRHAAGTIAYALRAGLEGILPYLRQAELDWGPERAIRPRVSTPFHVRATGPAPLESELEPYEGLIEFGI
jgi:hypothetical protein